MSLRRHGMTDRQDRDAAASVLRASRVVLRRRYRLFAKVACAGLPISPKHRTRDLFEAAADLAYTIMSTVPRRHRGKANFGLISIRLERAAARVVITEKEFRKKSSDPIDHLDQ